MIRIVVLAAASDPRPDENNVVAGWVGFAVLIALIVAVVFILRSFTKQLKKVDAAREAGVYDDPDDASDARSDQPPTHQQG
jgi:F0F1-type ATP synthase membrane subunit b/b'